VSIEAGNLYRYLRSLEEDGLVIDVPARSSDADDRRIYYRLTPLGRRVLTAELDRLRSLIRHAEAQGIIARSRA
jgi:DNA-binding PadR family transcriptional regulator